jgi:hypothetical protein
MHSGLKYFVNNQFIKKDQGLMKKKNNTHSLIRLKSLLFRTFLLLAILMLCSGRSWGQSTANYYFTTGATGSLVADINSNALDMSSGTTQLVAASIDDSPASSLTNLNLGTGNVFDFWFMGSRYTQFGVTANGIITLGVVPGTTVYALPNSTVPTISAFANDMQMGSDGKIEAKVFGAYPNRVLVIQWTKVGIRYSVTTGTATFQVRLYESSGLVEFVYGSMTTNSSTPTSYYVGFSINTTANNVITVNTTAHTASTSATVTSNSYTASSTITSLNSAADGSRRYYRFTPPSLLAAPTSLSFTSVGLSGMTLNWAASSPTTGILKYAIYNSTDNVNFNFANTVALGTNTYAATGLSAGTTYYWKVFAISEGALSSALTGTQATTSCSISGTKTIGASGCDYTTITAAVNAINSCGVSGPVVFQLKDATYSTSETFPITINAIAGASATNTITFKPYTGITSTISGSVSNGALIKLNTSKYIIFDGSNSGGTDKNLTIQNTSVTSPNIMWIGGTSSAIAQYDVIKNCILINGINSSSGIIISDATTSGSAGYFNDITLQNNSIQKAYMGIYAIATVATSNGSGLLITGNDLSTSGTNAIRYIGVYVQGVDGVTVSNNTIGNISNANAESPKGIWFATSTNNGIISGNTISTISFTNTGAYALTGIYLSSTATNISITGNTIQTLSNSGTALSFAGILSFSPSANITNNTVSGLTQNAAYAFWGIVQSGGVNSTISDNIVSGLTTSTTGTASGINIQGASTGVSISKNKISNIKNTNSSGYNAEGITLASSSTTANITVSNNFVSDVAGYGYASNTTRNGYGINISSGGGYNLYFNSVNLATNQTLATGIPACLFINSAVTTASCLDIRNNIFSIPATVGTNRYAVLCNAANTVFSNMDYNDYYSSGSNLGYIGASNRSNLAAWKTGTGKDVNSVSVSPTFTTSTNLHLASSVGTAVTGTGITTDIDGDARSGSAPWMGADEVVSCVAPTISSVTPTNPTCSGSDGSIAIVSSGTVTDYSKDNGSNWSSSSNNSFTFSSLATGTYNIKVRNTVGCITAYGSNPVTLVSSFPAISSPTSATVTSTTADLGGNITATGASNVTERGIYWSTNNGFADGAGTKVSATPGPYSTGTYTVNVSGLTASTQYYYKAFCTNTCGTVYTAQGTFTTTCAAISSFPWTEGFEGVIIPAFPNCWLKENGDWVTTNNSTSTYDADAKTGTQFLRDAYSATNEYIWTPGFSLTSGNTYAFSFWWAGDTYTDWTGDVFCNTSQSSIGATQLGTSFVTSGTTTTMTYVQNSNNFTPSSTGTYYFAIRINATATPWYLSFDDFSFTTSCTAPSAPTTSGAARCGTGTASLSASGAVSGEVYKWYDASTGGTLLKTSTDQNDNTYTTSSISTTTTYYVTRYITATSCESSTRTPVVATINSAPSAITITPSSATVVAGTIQSLVASGGSGGSGNATIGTGVSTNTSTTYPAPYTNYYGGTKHQMLIKASELISAGLTSGSDINSVKFIVSSVGSSFSGSLSNFQIDMGLTAVTALGSSSFISGLTNVFPAQTVAISVGTITHTLNTPFTWDGTSNLVIQTSYSNVNSGTSTDYVLMPYTDASFVSTNWYKADDATAAAILSAATPSSSSNYRPNIVLGYSSTPAPITWSPITYLYTDAAATSAYSAGTDYTSVYSKPDATTTYTATATNAGGCTSSANVTVTVSGTCTAPTIDAKANDSDSPSALCAGTSIHLDANPSGGSNCGTWEYAWYTGDGSGSTYYNGTSWTNAENYNSTWATVNNVYPSSTTTYKSKVRCVATPSCNRTDATGVTITVTPAPATPTASNNGPVCEGGTINLYATTVSGATYSWTGPNSFTSTDQNPTIINTGVHEGGTYDVTAIVGTCSSASSATTVEINTAPSFSVSPQNQSTSTGNNVSFSVTASNATSYQWQVSTNAGSTWTTLSNGGTDPVYSGVTTTTLTLTGVVSGNNGNMYQSVASGSCPPAVASDAATLTVSSCVTPGTPGSVAGIATGTSAANISWAAGTSGSSTITYYWAVGTVSNVTYGTVGSNGVVAQGTTTNTYAYITGLSCNTTYYVGVCAKTSCNSYATSSTTANSSAFLTLGGSSCTSFKSMGTGAWSSSSDWNVMANCNGSWSGASTYPESGNSCTIEICSGNTITLDKSITSSSIIIDAGGTLQITNSSYLLTLSSGVTLTNNGNLIINAGGSSTTGWDGYGLKIDGGTLINNGTITINTNGVICLYSAGSTILNYGTITNNGGCYYSPEVAGGLYAKYGGIYQYNTSSTISNYGTLTNNDPSGYYYQYHHGSEYDDYFRGILILNNFNNYGTLNNNNTYGYGYSIISTNSGTLKNYSSGVINNLSGLNIGNITLPETFENNGTVNESWAIIIDGGSSFTNASSGTLNINSSGCLKLSNGTVTNNGTIENLGTGTAPWAGIDCVSGTTFTNNGSVIDNGTLYNDGTFTNSTTSSFVYKKTTGSITGSSNLKYAGNALLKYNGTIAQTTSAKEWPTSSNVPNYITIDNSNASGVSLDAAKTLSGVLTLTTGALKLNQKTLTINNSATTAITRTNGFLVSEQNAATNTSILTWNMGTTTGSFVIPFGTADVADNYIPLTLNKTSSGSANLSISTRATLTSDNTPWTGASDNSTIAAVSNLNDLTGTNISTSSVLDRWWDIYPSAAVTADITFSYRGAENTTGQSTELAVQHWTGSSWNNGKGGGGGSYTATGTNGVTSGVGTVTATGLTQFSPYVLVLKSKPLPIELIEFSASCSNGKIEVKWTTASEVNNDYFTLERSMDARTWKALVNIPGAGNSNSIQYYQYTDAPSLADTTYYRLVQTDYNGQSETFDPVSATCGNIVEPQIEYFPNPFRTEVFIRTENLHFNKAKVLVWDMFGNMVINKTFLFDEIIDVIKLDLSYLSDGIYTVRFSGDDFVDIQKIIKK